MEGFILEPANKHVRTEDFSQIKHKQEAQHGVVLGSTGVVGLRTTTSRQATASHFRYSNSTPPLDNHKRIIRISQKSPSEEQTRQERDNKITRNNTLIQQV